MTLTHLCPYSKGASRRAYTVKTSRTACETHLRSERRANHSPPGHLERALDINPFMNSLVWLAIVAVVIWIVLRVALAITSGILHLLWIAAIIMFVMWLYHKVRGKKA